MKSVSATSTTRARRLVQPASRNSTRGVGKVPTGIPGLDQITGGGFPRGRAALVAGGPGSGKTLLGMEFVLRGALEYGEPGVVMSFEETAEELATNMKSLGHDVPALVRDKKLLVDHVHIERREIEETGEYDLQGLFIRLEHAIDTIKAKRVLLDTVEVLFSGLQNIAVVRSELRRMFRWLKDKGVTAVVTAEMGAGELTRRGLEEYVADCVIMLDHRVSEQISTRRIRVVKYRGSFHGTNEYPFLIDNDGISVLPITAIGLTHQASTERLSSGIEGLDEMLGGRGFYRASSVLVSGTAGTGKSILAAHFANATCARGERCLYFAFEESPSQILRNMRSVGMNLEPWMNKGLLKIHAVRPTSAGLENHLVDMHRHVAEWNPSTVVVDPITNLISVGEMRSVKSMLTRLIDFLKMQRVTALFTNLSVVGGLEETTTEISSLMDVWILLRDVEAGTARRRVVYILKSRGMGHSSTMREFRISNEGVDVKEEANGGDSVNSRGANEDTVMARQGSAKGGKKKLATRARRAPTKVEKWRLRLYVAGNTPNSIAAFANLKEICEVHLGGTYNIEVIDLVANPQLAKGDQIVAVPTLVRRLPHPVKKIIGDLSNTERVLVGLDLKPAFVRAAMRA